MRKILVNALLVIILVLGLSQMASAASEIQVVLDGVTQEYDQSPLIENGSTLVPMRKIFESLSAEVKWDDKNKQVNVYSKTICIAVQLNNKNATVYDLDPETGQCVNEKIIILAVAAKITNGNTMVPLRFVSEYLGAKVLWDGKNRIIRIFTDPNDKNYAILKQAIDSGDTKETKPTTNSNATKLIDGFSLFKADGFTIQTPKDWVRAYSSVNSSGQEKTYKFIYKDDIAYETTLTILPYDKSKDYIAFAQYNSSQIVGDFKRINLSNADVAYQAVDYHDSIGRDSQNTIMACKNDVCYILDAHQNSVNPQGGYIEMYTTAIAKYKADVDKMFSSFMLDKEFVSIKQITSTTINAQEFSDQANQIQRNNTTPLDELGTLIHANDIVSSSFFSGSVIETKGSKVLVYWESVSDTVPKKDINYWASLAGIKYEAKQWVDSITVTVQSSGENPPGVMG